MPPERKYADIKTMTQINSYPLNGKTNGNDVFEPGYYYCLTSAKPDESVQFFRDITTPGNYSVMVLTCRDERIVRNMLKGISIQTVDIKKHIGRIKFFKRQSGELSRKTMNLMQDIDDHLRTKTNAILYLDDFDELYRCMAKEPRGARMLLALLGSIGKVISGGAGRVLIGLDGYRPAGNAGEQTLLRFNDSFRVMPRLNELLVSHFVMSLSLSREFGSYYLKLNGEKGDTVNVSTRTRLHATFRKLALKLPDSTLQEQYWDFLDSILGMYGINSHDVRMIEGMTHLVKDGRPERAYALFSLLYRPENSGMIISRTAPQILGHKYNINSEVECHWLSTNTSNSERSIRPRLENIRGIISEYCARNRNATILLDGLEFLIHNNGFSETLSFIWYLRDDIATTRCRLIIPLNSDTLSKRERMLLERELEPI